MCFNDVSLCSEVYAHDNKHVKEIVDSLKRNPGHEPIVADLILFSLEKTWVLTYSNIPREKQDYELAAKTRKIQFLAMSGQHSPAAGKAYSGVGIHEYECEQHCKEADVPKIANSNLPRPPS